MAKQNDGKLDPSTVDTINNLMNGINASMDDLYKSTYMSSPQQSRDLDNLNTKINDNIDRIVNRNLNTIGVPSISKLYARATNIKDSQAQDISKDLENMFDNGLIVDDLYALFMSNRYLRELDNEIDTVCAYMPDLQEALDVQKDCVLSADHFSKDFLSFSYPGNGVDETVFADRTKELKDRYDLARLVEEIYETTSKYGEQFIYRVPYKKAIGRLLATKPNTQLVAPIRNTNESTVEEDQSTEVYMFNMTQSGSSFYSNDSFNSLTEASNFYGSNNSYVKDSHPTVLGDGESFSLQVEINKSGIIESAIRDRQKANNVRRKYINESLCIQEANETRKKNERKNIEAKGIIDWRTDTFDSRIIPANDGLINSTDVPTVDVTVPGCVVKKLERDRVIPVYIDDMCMGYYYFELRSLDTSESFMGFKNILGDPLTNMRNVDSRIGFNSVDSQRQDDTIRYVASQLSKFIDKQFVDSNQDLAKEIYMILKYNDLFNTPSIENIKVTFIPPEDMVHFYFRLDPETHRGISDLAKGLIPAKLYASLQITNTIGILTRGQDKRVYYVKQSVDTNISQVLLNTINQIKQGNFGIRQFQNINNILNITGRFNDYVIPTNASGDAPIQFEVMQGQDINTPTELMDGLKEAAINSTGIPIEIIQTRNQVDYAMQLTMSNSKVLRFCYKRQELFQKLLTELITPLYNYQYGEQESSITVTLPPPTFINTTNTTQLMNNTKDMVEAIVEMDLANEEDDQLKNAYKHELFNYYLGSHIDVSKHEEILKRVKTALAAEKSEAHSDESGSEY